MFIADNSGPGTVWVNDGTSKAGKRARTFSDTGQSLGNANSLDVALSDLDGASYERILRCEALMQRP